MQNSGMGQDGPKEPIIILLSDLSFHHRFFLSQLELIYSFACLFA